MGGTCLSQTVVDTVTSLNKALSCYLGYTQSSDSVTIGNIEDCKE